MDAFLLLTRCTHFRVVLGNTGQVVADTTKSVVLRDDASTIVRNEHLKNIQ